jgi:geranylgeranyl diphosphate synthase type II
MMSVSAYKDAFIAHLEGNIEIKEPIHLYEPITYLLQLGGKRLRPVLALMTTEIFGQDYKKALDVALAIEVFHNFSLVHDDIMDQAPLRRGKQTVHEKWDVNTGILSGDAMLILAYQFFENYEAPTFKKLAQLFSQTALEVCEGQQYDVDFESRDDVTIAEYLKMIAYKTAVLVGASMKMGALVAEAAPDDAQLIYDFGLYLGIAFQLQDDYLDAFGDPESFGKQVGGDIIERKKTYLYIKAMQNANAEERDKLQACFGATRMSNEAKVEGAKEVFVSTKADEMIKEAITAYTNKAFAKLETLAVAEEKKAALRVFGSQLMNRTY